MIEFENGKRNSKDEPKIRISESSVNSNPELKGNKIFSLRISLILINIISTISGCYILKNKKYYLSPENGFEYHNSLFLFIVLYTLGMVAALIFSFLFTLIIKIFSFIYNLFNSENPKLIKSEEQRQSESSLRFILENANELSLIPYTFTIFVVTTCILYLISLPYTIFLLIFLNKNDLYSNYKDFHLLYFFVVINMIAGLILFYVSIIVVFVKRDGSFRKRSYYIDDNNLNNLRNEIRDAIQKAEG